MLLLNPRHLVRHYPDQRSREIMEKTVAFFEKNGLTKLKADFHGAVWYEDFLNFCKEECIFASMMTPAEHGKDGEHAVWDTWRVCGFAEILGFYGLPYWYAYQVSVLGIGPIWMSKNKVAQAKAKRLLDQGEVFAFGLSEKEHGADIYSSDMIVTKLDDGTYLASGGKYYIGNANKARMVSTFGKMADTGEYIYFVADSQHPQYELVKNVVYSQNYVAEYQLHEYPLSEDDILHHGDDAWNAALNTVNVGKYNLGWASIGICTHAFYEAFDHASNRHLYNMTVTDFPHVRQLFTDAYARLVAMKLFGLRAADYMKAASNEDRRYLLFNPIQKMKVTTQGEEVINLLWDVIAAKGFEKDMYFAMAAIDIRGLPKLEGTVHVNMALIIKFMANYFFAPAVYPEVARRDEGSNDSFLFDQGPTKGLGKIKFHDYRIAYNSVDTPNLSVFKEQIETFKQMAMLAPPTPAQAKDIDFLLTVGEMFTLVVYGQLVLENAKIYEVEPELLDQIFDFMVRDFSKFALQMYSKPSSTEGQMAQCLKMIRKPVTDDVRYAKVWSDHVSKMQGQYKMPD
ncbi:MAG: acyl-CoA dehydrogenase [Rhodoferax sp.]|uniref:acyl-CoA dehydrogenase family protein n=1 Tax=Rhodoferax sp. TaxID=50421 RepID=UPI0013FF51D4|nr:acyl-CoA dehydrogenase family protein [Rhodoferax sp.]NDP38424.1 acyl-CoA dehydrogenase [Rhodoferax sp.]